MRPSGGMQHHLQRAAPLPCVARNHDIDRAGFFRYIVQILRSRMRSIMHSNKKSSIRAIFCSSVARSPPALALPLAGRTRSDVSAFWGVLARIAACGHSRRARAHVCTTILSSPHPPSHTHKHMRGPRAPASPAAAGGSGAGERPAHGPQAACVRFVCAHFDADVLPPLRPFHHVFLRPRSL